MLSGTSAGQHNWLSITHVLLPSARPESGTLVYIFHDVTEEVEAKRLVRRLGSMLAKAPRCLLLPVPRLRKRLTW